MFHAVGLNVIDAREIRRDFLSKDVLSRKKEIILFSLSAMAVSCRIRALEPEVFVACRRRGRREA